MNINKLKDIFIGVLIATLFFILTGTNNIHKDQPGTYQMEILNYNVDYSSIWIALLNTKTGVHSVKIVGLGDKSYRRFEKGE